MMSEGRNASDFVLVVALVLESFDPRQSSEKLHRRPSMPSSPVQFDHEKLDVYQLSLGFITWTSTLFGELRDAKIPQTKEVVDQLDRASISVVLNIAEGNGRRTGQARAKFFDDARGSATECAACLDVMVATGACGSARMTDGKVSLLRVVSMLCKLVEKFDETARKEAR
jgi:four helix bundle protein